MYRCGKSSSNHILVELKHPRVINKVLKQFKFYWRNDVLSCVLGEVFGDVFQNLYAVII